MSNPTPIELFEDLQDLVVAQRAALVEALKIIHEISPDGFQEALRQRRMLAQAVEAGRIGSGSARMSKIHGLVRDILEEAAESDEHLDEDDE